MTWLLENCLLLVCDNLSACRVCGATQQVMALTPGSSSSSSSSWIDYQGDGGSAVSHYAVGHKPHFKQGSDPAK